MIKIVNKIVSAGVKLFNGLSQEEAQKNITDKTVTPGMPEILRKAAAEGAVLLKNDSVLPFKENTSVSLFGRVQLEWFYTGYGSGGEVVNPYAVNLADGVRNCNSLLLNENLADIYKTWNDSNPIDHGYWGHWPRCYDEMPLTAEIVNNANSQSDVAVITIGRSSGEDRENALEKGSYYLTDEEENMFSLVTEKFDKTVVLLNIGGIMDLSWVEKYNVSAVLIVWQGGMESGNAVCDLLCGNVTPSGKLTDTVARYYEDYPSANNFGGRFFNNYEEDIYVGYRYFETFYKDRVLFPFGFGLSYTEFEIKFKKAKVKDDKVFLEVKVKNEGKYDGKQVVQVYVQKPCAPIGNPAKVLVAFKKTSLLKPGDKENLLFEIPVGDFVSYDSVGATGNPYSYVIEKGKYVLFVGDNVRDACSVFEYDVEDNILIQEHSQVMAPKKSFDVFDAKKGENGYILAKRSVPTDFVNLKTVIEKNIPAEIPQTGDKGIKLADVKNGSATMEQFVAQLDFDELEAITRGDYTMNSPLGAKGNAGAFGGVLPSLRNKGVPAVITTDGPSGIRLYSSCSLIPIGTLLACSFDESLVEEVYGAISREMVEKGTDMLLAPGMNIHRNVLCGRNFEYYSEDPVVTGKIAAAAVRGIQSCGVSACPKHFACNNQEFKRNKNDSRVSERALREIYLKGFEICVKESSPKAIMTSYNKINSVYSHYNYQLCTTVLRREWNYKGVVITDWWMQKGRSHEFENVTDNAYRIRGGIDVLMPGGSRTGKRKPDGSVKRSFESGGITLGELQQTAIHVLNHAMNSTAMNR